jgi:hypothetical protein
MFSQTAPRYNDNGDYNKITIISPSQADYLFPNWQDAADLYPTSSPTHGWLTNQNTLNLLPLPNGGDVELTYVKRPDDMVQLDDEPFDGNVALNRFAIALAYKMANRLTLPRNPQYATILNNMYIEEQKKLRDYLRRDPQQHQAIRPGRASSYTLADRIEDWRNT